MITDLIWQKTAFDKLAALGAIVLLPTTAGKYLLQVCDADDESTEGKTRPPGGHKSKSDKNLRQTIVREIQEEFGLAKADINADLKFLGMEYRPDFRNNAVFELKNHGLKPGLYQASNSPDEKIKLVEGSINSSRYVGPDPDLLLTEEENKEWEDAKNASWDFFKEAADNQVTELFTPDFTPEDLTAKNVDARLLHELKPTLASMRKWPKEWRPSQDDHWLTWFSQYHHGRRSSDDPKQIKRWLNFKARHGEPYKTNPTPRRAWALTNWGIDPIKLLPANRRGKAQQEMLDYQQKIDKRDQDSKMKSARETGKPTTHLPGSPNIAEKVAPPGFKEDQLSQGTKVEGEHTTNAPTARAIAVDHLKEDPNYYDHLEEMENKYQGKEGRDSSGAQGIMGGPGAIASGVPPLLVPPPAMGNEVKIPLFPLNPLIKENDKEAAAQPQVPQTLIQSQKAQLSPSLAGKAQPLGSSPAIHELGWPAGASPGLSDSIGALPMGQLGQNHPMLLGQKAQTMEEQKPRTTTPASIPNPTVKSALHERVVAWAKEEPCPKCGTSEHEDTAITNTGKPGEEKIKCGHCGAETPAVWWHGSKSADAGNTTAAVYPGTEADVKAIPSPNTAKRTPVTMYTNTAATETPQKSSSMVSEGGPILDGNIATSSSEGVKTQIIDPARPLSIGDDVKDPTQVVDTTKPNDPTQVVDTTKPNDPTHALSPRIWAKNAMAVDSAGIPTTGPEAIQYALQNLDLGKMEDDARTIIRKKLKSKRPDAVKLLGYLEGLKKTGIKPHELMLTRVPVIPPQFRPFTVAGDTFVPGDANELYRDLINTADVHRELETKLGRLGAGPSRLHLYDAVRAVYGFGEPTSPKTRERGVNGFLEKVTGVSPKFSFFQRQMLSRNMDYVGRGTVGVDPDLTMDEIGIPDNMAWKLYAPYIQRRLVRAGMSPTQAVKYITDRHEMAAKHLDLELKERPVMYSRSPAWHRGSMAGGWAKRIPGDMIRVNPLVTTAQNMDFDGDQINLHVPSLHDSVYDVKNKLMPSKMLFSIKDRNKVMPVIKQESVLGNYAAQHRPAKNSHQFPDEASALAAIRSGKVLMSDEVQIGGKG